MGRNPKLWEFVSVALAVVLALALGPVACTQQEPTVGPTNISGVERDLTPLFLEYDVTPPERGLKQDYALGERPTIRVIIVALKKGENGKQDQQKVESFAYPIIWERIGITETSCSLQNFTLVSADARCRAPGIHQFQAHMTINGVHITSPEPATLPFQ